MAHTVIPPPRCMAATLELTHKGNVNDKTVTERDREVKDSNVTLLAYRTCVLFASEDIITQRIIAHLAGA